MPDGRVDDPVAEAAGPEVRRWLEPRLGRVPADLATAVRSAVDRALEKSASAPVSEVLARAAVWELDRVTGMEGRDAALTLLAADASLTYAFEAAAEDGSDPTALADLVGLRGAIGRRLAASERSVGA